LGLHLHSFLLACVLSHSQANLAAN
jgi:hypothetical protein